MRLQFQRKDFRCGVIVVLRNSWRDGGPNAPRLLARPRSRQFSHTAILGVEEEPRKRSLSVPDMLELKWDQDARAFVKPVGENTEVYLSKGGLVSNPWGKKSTSNDKRRKVRVAPLRNIARRAECIQQAGRDGVDEEQVYMLLSCLRAGDTERAEKLLWKLMLEYQNSESAAGGGQYRRSSEELEMCVSGILAAYEPNDLDRMMRLLKKFTRNLPKGARIPPARCVAYILHCACESEDVEKGTKIVVEVVYDWEKTYGRKMREIQQHQDILTEADLQRLERVSSIKAACIFFG